MKPGDLVKFIEGSKGDTSVIMTVLRVHKESVDDGWAFCTAGRKQAHTVDVFYPTKGVRTFKDGSLTIVSDDHASPRHAKLTALAFAGSCSNKEGDCNE